MLKYALSAALLIGPLAQAQFLVPGDDPYFSENAEDIQYIYSESNAEALPELKFYMGYFIDKYTQSFGWTLDEKLRLVIASNRNQIANGFATPTPLLETVHFTAGADLMDEFASDSFMLALSSHETAHLYQLSAKSRMSSMVKSVLGNPVYILVGIPFFVFPNAFLPRFVVEGNAVLNESTIRHGGRLWSGEIRAEVLAQVKAGKVSPTSLMNSRLEFPFGGDAYHQGGYFMGYLAERFGLERTNHFFLTHAQRDFFPWALNKSFRQHFGASYSRIIHDYLHWIKPWADAHQVAQGTLLAQTLINGKFNHDGQSIFFATNMTGHEANRLLVFNKSQQTLAIEHTHLQTGKAFRIDGKAYSAGSSWASPTLLEYGLYTEGLKKRSGSGGKIYQDIRAGHELTIDASSYVKSSLAKDGKFLDYTGSSAILDEQGRAYYFRQVGDDHVLYREREVLFKYKGYYGFPLEVTTDGDVLFIASSKYGSSVFRWRKSGVERLSPADNIVDARLINDRQLLVSAITDKGFDLRQVDVQAQSDVPAWYDWKFTTTELPPVAAAPNAPKGETSELGSVGEMHFSQIQLATSGSQALLGVLFTDPMMWNIAAFQYEYTAGPDHAAEFLYRNGRHRLGWQISGGYGSDSIKSPKKRSRRRDAGFAAFHLDYDLIRQGAWTSSLLVGPRWANDSLVDDRIQQIYGGEVYWQTVFARHFGISFDPTFLFYLNLHHRTDLLATTSNKADSINDGEIHLSGDIFRETYLGASGSWARAEINSIRVNYLKAPKADDTSELTVPMLLSDGQASEVREWSVSLKQAINWGYYFTRFPISLRRLAPFVNLRDIYSREYRTRELPKWRQQFSYGIEWELLFLNEIPFRIQSIYDTINIGGKHVDGYRFGLSLVKEF